MTPVVSRILFVVVCTQLVHNCLCGITNTQEYLNNGDAIVTTPNPSTDEKPPEETITWPFSDAYFTTPIQSPVDIITSQIKERKDLKPLNIYEPKMPDVQAKFLNSGHTVFVYIDSENKDVRPYLEGGPLQNKFIFEQMHFHWGKEDVKGSEHCIDGNAFSIEIHMVHFNNKYKNFEEAAKKGDGLAVLTVFAETRKWRNLLLDALYDLLPKVRTAHAYQFLPWDKAMQWPLSALRKNPVYYTYPGSLTTPNYSQNVAFIILPIPIRLSKEQLHGFRRLHSENGLITENKRGLQPLNNRPIFQGEVAPQKNNPLDQEEQQDENLTQFRPTS